MYRQLTISLKNNTVVTHRQLFFQHIAQTSDFPLALEIERAEGIYLYGASQRYIDLISGIGVSNVGHRHPRVLAAIQEQLDKYLHLMVYGEFVQTPQVELAHALAQTLPEPLSSVYFTNSGTEAIEGTMKLAKRFTGRREIISCFNAYHGATQGALSLSGSENFKRSFRPLLPGIRHIQHGDWQHIEKITKKTAAVIMEVVQGEAGVRVPEAGYLQAVRQRCTEVGTLLVFDEIQTGFGRTGTLFGFEDFDSIPDVLLLAKGIGGGMPIGAFISSKEIMAVLAQNPILGHITTFGGHPLSCAAGLATLNAILKENLVKDVHKKGELFKSLLQHPEIKEVRGKGLMLAVEFDSYETNKRIIDGCIADGIITDWFLHCSNSMRIAPPLIITEEEIKEACKVILKNINLFATPSFVA